MPLWLAVFGYYRPFFGTYYCVSYIVCTVHVLCLVIMYCIFVLCTVSLYYALYHCSTLSVQDVLCLCGALAGADNGFPRLTWRAAALLIRLALIIVIIVLIVLL